VALRRRLGIELKKPEWEFHELNKDPGTIEEKAFKLRTLAENGDALAIQLFKQQGFILGYGIADLVRVFDPGLVVIGGGLAESEFRGQFMEWVKEGFNDRAWPIYRHSPIEPEKATTVFQWAEGGDAAASIGMAYTARELFA
jgi:predicted NBD/HSP70 family sugar kinase